MVALIASSGLQQFSGPRLAAVAGLLWPLGLAGISATYLLHFLFVVREGERGSGAQGAGPRGGGGGERHGEGGGQADEVQMERRRWAVGGK